MNASIDKIHKSLFDEMDTELLCQLKGSKITYKKETVTKLVLNHLGDHDYSRAEASNLVNAFVKHFKETLLGGSSIVIKKHGKLVPRVKVGGRPVRDLSRGTKICMEETATVTFSKTQKSLNGKVSSRQLIASFVENYNDEPRTQYLAKFIAATFFACIARTRSDNHRMEVRGLGVFRSQRIKERAGRNPKTGEETKVVETVYPRFRVSKPFRLQLLESLS